MKTYYSNDFKGHWPVGTSAVIMANNREEANNLLIEECKKHGLTDLGNYTIVEIKGTKPICLVLQNGEY